MKTAAHTSPTFTFDGKTYRLSRTPGLTEVAGCLFEIIEVTHGRGHRYLHTLFAGDKVELLDESWVVYPDQNYRPALRAHANDGSEDYLWAVVHENLLAELHQTSD